MFRQKKLVLATHNSHKKEEMNLLLSPMGITIVGLDDFPQIGDIEETGSTLLENSLIKAHTVYKMTKLPSLADDTGLEVDYLNGHPGVYSARYAGESPSYNDNINKLLSELADLPISKRGAKFRTVISFFDGKTELNTEGVIKGIITLSPFGRRGFGYDPIFQPEFFNRTFAQMDPDEKNKISHRGKALVKMKTILENYFDKV